MNERLDEEGIKALLSNEIRSSLTYDDTELLLVYLILNNKKL